MSDKSEESGNGRTISSACVYCGSSGKVRESYRKAAADMGGELARNGIRLVYGGGKVGLMGICADAALSAGGEVTGIIPYFLDEMEVGHGAVTELIRTDNMHDRKRRMADLSDAFIVLPGGLGTLDETFEILTWRQLGLHDKPVVIVNIEGYWNSLISLIRHQVEENFARPANLDLFSVVDSVDAVLPALRSMPKSRRQLDGKWT